MIVGDVDGAIDLLNSGGVIGYPTEAVYGLGCNPWNKESVEKIAIIKKRSLGKPFLMVASSIDQLESLIDVTVLSDDVKATWPGHTTWLIKAKESVPYWLQDKESGKVGIRISNHPVVMKLCKLFKKPIISTSANISGYQEIKDEIEFRKTFASNVNYLVKGDIGDYKKTSIIIDMETNQKLR